MIGRTYLEQGRPVVVPTHLRRLRIYRPGLPPYPIMPPASVYAVRWAREMPREWRLLRAQVFQRESGQRVVRPFRGLRRMEGER